MISSRADGMSSLEVSWVNFGVEESTGLPVVTLPDLVVHIDVVLGQPLLDILRSLLYTHAHSIVSNGVYRNGTVG